MASDRLCFKLDFTRRYGAYSVCFKRLGGRTERRGAQRAAHGTGIWVQAPKMFSAFIGEKTSTNASRKAGVVVFMSE
jgi:hypothetical protein